jgi:hypothetical protein
MKQLADTFWNIRGVHRIAGFIDIGTQMSVAQRPGGGFIVIDGCALEDEARDALLALTKQGARVDAVVHVHPFHTMHVESTHALLPDAKLYGTARHRERLPALPWAGTPVEGWGADHPLADTLDLSVPAGVDFVCIDESVHVASVLVRHLASGIVHVDDTLNVLAAPGALGELLPQSSLKMHPMLGKALKTEPGATEAYAQWARDLALRWADTPMVCAAHSAVRTLSPGGFREEVEAALAKVSGTLERHRKQYG